MNYTEKKDVNIFERHPWKTIVCFVLVCMLILDFLSANIYRFFNGYPWASKKEVLWYKVERSYHIRSKFYGHDLAPKKTIHGVYWGPNIYNVYTNALGFRDKSIRDISLTSNKYRIVFIGDSFTEGLGIDYENTFVGLIDAALSKKGIEVFNAGVSSYSPIIYWRKVKYLIENVGLRFDQLVVFIDIGDAEDEAIYYFLNESGNVGNWYDPKIIDLKINKRPSEVKNYYVVLYRRLKTGIKNNSILTYFILLKLHVIPFLKALGGYDSTYTRGGWTFDDKLYQEYGEYGLRKMQLYMDKLYDLLNKNNIKLTVAVYPWPIQIMHHDLNSIQVTFWRDWCRRHSVNFINYFPYFVTSTTTNGKKQVIDKYFIKDDTHWNKKGHRLIADVFLADYENKK